MYENVEHILKCIIDVLWNWLIFSLFIHSTYLNPLCERKNVINMEIIFYNSDCNGDIYLLRLDYKLDNHVLLCIVFYYFVWVKMESYWYWCGSRDGNLCLLCSCDNENFQNYIFFSLDEKFCNFFSILEHFINNSTVFCEK